LLVNLNHLKAIYKEAPESRLILWRPFLNWAMQQYDIHSTKERVAMFLAQIGHESGQLRYVLEVASGAAYEGRLDLGNTQPGDGVRYKGRGLIQITGRANYKQAGEALGLPLLSSPELLEQPKNAAHSAAWWWNSRKLSEWADKKDLEKTTRIINGGLNGFEDRKKLYQRALESL
jgi:putative chitinase